MIDAFIRESKDGVCIRSIIQTGTSKNKIVGIVNDALKIQIMAQPIEGKANSEIIKFLSKVFDIAKSRINIAKGEKQKIKSIEISGISKMKVLEILEEIEKNG